jgi:hypothetical protein
MIMIEPEFDPSEHASIPEMLFSKPMIVLYFCAMFANFTNAFVNG